ncbi:MAG TPA: TrmJ/YjtD family RNA methyltransferase [Terriglobia bacterium]
MDPSAWSWRIALVRPRNPLNIGAAARAMANFGFRELVVVNPYEPTWQETRSAVGAGDLVRAAPAVPTLLEAIGDAVLVLGTTSGSRRHLARELVPLADLPAWLETRVPSAAKHRVLRSVLLFGSEKTGLSNDELSHCHALLRIPTSPTCPSMNLGQAVAVCCYELARQGLASGCPPGARLHRSDPASVQSLAHLFERVARLLDATGYLQPKSRQATLLKLRQLLLKLGLTNYDTRILGGILAQVEWKLGLLGH